MIDTYFFIPADKEKFLKKTNELECDYLVYDLEDAVAVENKQLAYNNLLNFPIRKGSFVRIPFFEQHFSTLQINKLVEIFEGRVLVPKLHRVPDFYKIKPLIEQYKKSVIVLIENARAFVEIGDLLKTYEQYMLGIGFGTHDFCTENGIKHSLDNLMEYKRHLIISAKAFDVKYIDSVDLDLNDFTSFKNECLFAFENGADGKFLIHPEQINQLQNVQYLSFDEIREIEHIYQLVKHINEQSIEVYKIDGKVYEKPHIKRINTLYNKIHKTI